MKDTKEFHRAQFIDFHSKNPHVVRLLARFADELTMAGHEKLSISLLTERVRWEGAVTTDSADGFKINNNFRAHYARILPILYPRFAGKFSTRRSAAE